MKIIRGKDYYDGGMAHGQDSGVVFVRQKKNFVERSDLPGWLALSMDLEANNERGKETLYLRSVQVYFCGKLYLGIGFETGRTDGNKDVFWDYPSLKSYLESVGVKIVRGHEKRLKEYFKASGNDRDRALLVDRRITIATLDMRMLYRYRMDLCWEVDGYNLADLMFYRKMDTFTAFQTISAWIAGVIPATPPDTAKIKNDKIRIEKRGFDSRMSFRKEPTKKKAKAKR